MWVKSNREFFEPISKVTITFPSYPESNSSDFRRAVTLNRYYEFEFVKIHAVFYPPCYRINVTTRYNLSNSYKLKQKEKLLVSPSAWLENICREE